MTLTSYNMPLLFVDLIFRIVCMDRAFDAVISMLLPFVVYGYIYCIS